MPSRERGPLRNVAVYDVNRGLLEAGDAFTLEAAERVWIDHDTFT